ncbi:MAG: hypothetical protein ABIP81_02450, partial [Terriglobales bacterium]
RQFSLDPRFLKNIRFTEKAKMQIFAEAFNILNHFNVSSARTTQYAMLANTATSTSNCGAGFAPGVSCLVPQVAPATRFGLPSGHTGARIFQLGAKLSF